MNPRSRFDYYTQLASLTIFHITLKQTSPPHEYTALHQHGNRVGNGGAGGGILQNGNSSKD